MSEPTCEHTCQFHIPDDGELYVRVWRGEEDALAQFKSQLEWYNQHQRRRILNWLNDYFTESVAKETP